MVTRTRVLRRPWTDQEDCVLCELVEQNTPTRLIGLKLQRTPTAIYHHASALGLSLKPTNQSPYNASPYRRRSRRTNRSSPSSRASSSGRSGRSGRSRSRSGR